MPDYSLTIEMAGLACTVMSPDRALAELVSRRYQGFLSRRSPRFTLTARIDPSASGDAPWDVVTAPASIDWHERRLRLSGDGYSADYDMTAGTGAMTLPFNLTPLDLVLKVLYAHYLLDNDACFMHACAVGHPGNVDLFFGPSGSGKSTLAGLAAQSGAVVLADELVIVRHCADAFTLYGTPFWSGCNASADIRGIFALCSERRNDAITTIRPMHALRRLLPCTGNFFHDAVRQSRLFTLLGLLAGSTACQALQFSSIHSMRGWLDARLGGIG